MKTIFCPIHGHITITPLMQSIIDTPEFQRLRDLKQLGTTYFVFPSATHTRFEHSLGVSYLAGVMGESLQKNQPELEITDREIELLRVAGVIHDIGHGPFSHLYDDYVIEENDKKHEERGCIMFREMVKKYNLNLNIYEVEEILRIVNPGEKEKDGWFYQIIANKVNQIDVDKIDYIQRDCYHIGMTCESEYGRLLTDVRVKLCDEKYMLAWPQKLQYEIFSLFSARYRLHKQVYNHHTNKSYEHIIIKILRSLNLKNIPFLYLTDSIVSCRLHSEFQYLQDQLALRNHSKFIGEVTCNINDLKKEVLHKIFNRIPHYTFEEIKIGFVSGNNMNPLQNVYYFDKDSEGYKIDCNKTSFMIPQRYQEVILRLYTKNEAVSDKDKKVWKCVSDIYNK